MSKPQTIAFLVATVICMATISSAADDHLSKFSITTKRSDDKVEIETDNEKAVFTIHSPFGISNAVIARTEDKWPNEVTLRLHLKGLENLQVTHAKSTLQAAVSSDNDRPSVRLWMNKNEDIPLDETSPFWMLIRTIGGDGNPTHGIPLENGYFEMKLPKAFFDENPNSITISWIDFYRT